MEEMRNFLAEEPPSPQESDAQNSDDNLENDHGEQRDEKLEENPENGNEDLPNFQKDEANNFGDSDESKEPCSSDAREEENERKRSIEIEIDLYRILSQAEEMERGRSPNGTLLTPEEELEMLQNRFKDRWDRGIARKHGPLGTLLFPKCYSHSDTSFHGVIKTISRKPRLLDVKWAPILFTVMPRYEQVEYPEPEPEGKASEEEVRNIRSPPAVWDDLNGILSSPETENIAASESSDDGTPEDEEEKSREIRQAAAAHSEQNSTSSSQRNHNFGNLSPVKIVMIDRSERKLYDNAMEQKGQSSSSDIVSVLNLRNCRSVKEFIILNSIGSGVYGDVFRAHDMATDRIVALKRFKILDHVVDRSASVLRELTLLRKAGNHQNILTVLEILRGPTSAEIYMAMEYVQIDMRTLLNQKLRDRETMSSEVRKSLMMQLLSGIEHVHNNWIIHRDLKTCNILLSNAGILKIADFGMAREYGRVEDQSRQHLWSPKVVTLWYRSPELLLRTRCYSTPIDLWSVGCIMAEIILLKPLLRGKNEGDQANLIFKWLGTPTEETWPEVGDCDLWNKVFLETYQPGRLGAYLQRETSIDQTEFDLLSGLLMVNPNQRLTATHALNHPYFINAPLASYIAPLVEEYRSIAQEREEEGRSKVLETILKLEEPQRTKMLDKFSNGIV